MVEILRVSQPCVLCEQPLEVWTYERDPETGAEHIERVPVDHDCPALKALMKERSR